MARESTENYLETIYILLQERGAVRSIDVCSALGYSKPTVSVAMKQFRERGYIEMEGGRITLTEEGLGIAQRTYARHQALSELLMALGVSEETAKLDACKIEHDISDETFACVKAYLAQRNERA